jgi:hypothetical protein
MNISLRGAGGIELEPNHYQSLGNEDYLLLIKNLLDVVEAMENPVRIVMLYYKVIC